MTIYSDNTKIIFEGEILEPYTFLRKLFFLARDDITRKKKGLIHMY